MPAVSQILPWNKCAGADISRLLALELPPGALKVSHLGMGASKNPRGDVFAGRCIERLPKSEDL